MIIGNQILEAADLVKNRMTTMIYTDKVFEDDALELLPAYLVLAEANIQQGPARLKKAEEFLIAAYWNLLKNSSDEGAKADDKSLVTEADKK